MKTSRPFISRVSSFLLDICIVYSLSLIVNLIAPLNQYIGTLQVFIVFLIIYSVICNIAFSSTLGKQLLQLQISTNSGVKPQTVSILIREVVKYSGVLLVFYIVKYIIANGDSKFTFFIDNNIIIIISLILSFILFIIIWIFIKKAWWDSFTGLTVKKIEVSVKKLKKKYLAVIVFLIISFLSIFLLNNRIQNHNNSFLGFKYPLHFKNHLINSSTNEYVSFLKAQNQSAVDYIFELYEDKDIVILCESNHREITQWDFISDIVHDERFSRDIGHVFTEYGASTKQEQVDSFLKTQFANDTILSQETAQLAHYMNTGFFNFMKNLNVLNCSLPDSLKVHEYFTDFDKYHEYILTSETPYRLNRDSLMASIVINKYRQLQDTGKRKKCLVITNTRHAYGRVIKDGEELNEFSKNEARYIFNEFPNKTANVLINCMAKNNYMLEYPIHYGEWDRAFHEIGNKRRGFDFKGNPFGKDKFDLAPWIEADVNYQDVFTGFVFVTPTNEWKFNSYYQFRQYAATKEYKEKIRNGISPEYILESFEYNRFKDEVIWIIIQGFFNVIPYLFYLLLVMPGLIVLFIERLKLNKNN